MEHSEPPSHSNTMQGPPSTYSAPQIILATTLSNQFDCNTITSHCNAGDKVLSASYLFTVPPNVTVVQGVSIDIGTASATVSFCCTLASGCSGQGAIGAMSAICAGIASG